MKFKKLLILLLCAAFASGIAFSGCGNTHNGEGTDNSGNTDLGGDNTGNGDNTGDTEVDNSIKLTDKKIFVVGDSTVCDYSEKPDNYYLQRYGYGTQLYNYLNLESKFSAFGQNFFIVSYRGELCQAEKRNRRRRLSDNRLRAQRRKERR